jgi:site-specific DNA-methyltransferase (adenine-specific)
MSAQNTERLPPSPLGRFPANLVHVPKASRAERELGCEGLPTKTGAEATGSKEGQARLDSPRTGAGRSADAIRNFHPTVKPLGLMRWLVRLVTPPGGVVLDPFMGSGTTGMAVVGQGYGGFIGCELVAEHLQIARARIEYAATGQAVDCDLADSRTPPTQPSMF